MKNELTDKEEKLMTTKELAEALNVDVRTVQRVANDILNPATVLSRVVNGGVSKVFTEAQTTAIKIELQNHSKVAQNGFNTLTINNDLEENHTMTVKEIAEELHVSDQTIRNIVKELFDPSKLLWRVVNGGNTLLLTYEQATAIKLKLRTRNNLKDSSVVSQIGNDLEFFALLKKREEEQRVLDEYRDRRIQELQQQLEAQRPDVEFSRKIQSSSNVLKVSEIAKVLELGYGDRTLYRKLVELGILMKDHTPYQEYMNRGYFKVCISHHEENGELVADKTTKIYMKGCFYIARKLGVVGKAERIRRAYGEKKAS